MKYYISFAQLPVLIFRLEFTVCVSSSPIQILQIRITQFASYVLLTNCSFYFAPFYCLFKNLLLGLRHNQNYLVNCCLKPRCPEARKVEWAGKEADTIKCYCLELAKDAAAFSLLYFKYFFFLKLV